MGTNTLTYLILSQKSWNKNLASNLHNVMNGNWLWINKKEDFNIKKLNDLKPEKIFIPHWSHLISEEIYKEFECIVFHMTDLPYGRGGSPLQNLISKGYEETQITAIKVEEGIDTGDVYLKATLSLLGTAEEIFLRANKVIEQMIIKIIKEDLKPIPQQGEPVTFKRRTPSMSNLNGLQNLKEVYDHIRMLDAEGYPHAFIETEYFKFEFTRASIKADNSIIADVRIIKK